MGGSVGAAEGLSVPSVGASVGKYVGAYVGEYVGGSVGAAEGLSVPSVGASVGKDVGSKLGCRVGYIVVSVGGVVGSGDGLPVQFVPMALLKITGVLISWFSSVGKSPQRLLLERKMLLSNFVNIPSCWGRTIKRIMYKQNKCILVSVYNQSTLW